MAVTIDGTAGVTIPSTGGLSGVGSNSVQSFLAADVPLGTAGGSFVSGPNTGSVGASGQVWQITAVAMVNNTNNSAAFEIAIYNGSTYIANVQDTVWSANSTGVTTITATVTLTGATTFTLRARALADNNSNLKTTGAATGAANKATSITATRLS